MSQAVRGFTSRGTRLEPVPLLHVDSKPQPLGEHVDYSVLDTTDIDEGYGAGGAAIE